MIVAQPEQEPRGSNEKTILVPFQSPKLLDNRSEINYLIRQLGSNEFSEREEASKRLEQIGGQALQILIQMPAIKDLETRRRVRELIARIRRRGRQRAISKIKKIAGSDRVKIFHAPPDAVVCYRDGVLYYYFCSDTSVPLQRTAPDAEGCVREINLSGCTVTDKDLACLAYVDELELLDLSNTSITDSGLAIISMLHNLGRLDLRNTRVGDRGLAYISQLRKLSSLDLHGTRITDEGLRILGSGNLQKLTMLYLAKTRISDNGLFYIKHLRTIKWLTLGCTHVSDNGLVHLKQFDQLYYLDIADTGVTEAGLTHLQGLPELSMHEVAKQLTTRHKMSGGKSRQNR